MDLSCPSCNLPLNQVRMSKGIFWACDRCDGRAMTVELLRRMFTADSINPLWNHAISGEGVSSRKCPVCRSAMIEVNLSRDAAIKVDVCRRCHFIWFDAGETRALTPKPVAPAKPPMPQKAREAIALLEIDRMAREAQRSDAVDYQSGRLWTSIFSLLGLW